MNSDASEESIVAKLEEIAMKHETGVFVLRKKRAVEQEPETENTTAARVVRARHARAPDYQFVDEVTITVCEPKQMEATYFTPQDGPERITVTVRAIGQFFKKGHLVKTRHYEEIGAAISQWIPKTLVFNRIEIRTEPRYKQSELSGDEWRERACASFYNDAKYDDAAIYKLYQCEVKDLLTSSAVDENPWEYSPPTADDRCDQEGCSQEAEITLKLKNHVCTRCSATREADELLRPDLQTIYYRQFCNRHARRGDCGINDCDDNYIRIDHSIAAENRQPPTTTTNINVVVD